MNFKYTFKEKRLLKKINKSPYFWACDRSHNKNNLMKVDLQSNGKIFSSNISYSCISKNKKYNVWNDIIPIEDLTDIYHPVEWISDKDYADKLYRNALAKDKEVEYAIKNNILYSINKEYGTNNPFEFDHIQKIYIYEFKTGKCKYAYIEGLTDKWKNDLKKIPEYNEAKIEKIESMCYSEFEWLTKEQAHGYMIEQLYKECV